MESFTVFFIIAGILFALFTAVLACLVPWMLWSIKKSNIKSLNVLKEINNKLTKENKWVN